MLRLRNRPFHLPEAAQRAVARIIAKKFSASNPEEQVLPAD